MLPTNNLSPSKCNYNRLKLLFIKGLTQFLIHLHSGPIHRDCKAKGIISEE